MLYCTRKGVAKRVPRISASVITTFCPSRMKFARLLPHRCGKSLFLLPKRCKRNPARRKPRPTAKSTKRERALLTGVPAKRQLCGEKAEQGSGRMLALPCQRSIADFATPRRAVQHFFSLWRNQTTQCIITTVLVTAPTFRTITTTCPTCSLRPTPTSASVPTTFTPFTITLAAAAACRYCCFFCSSFSDNA